MVEKAVGNNYEHLSPKEVKEWGDFFEHLTRGIVNVGEIGLRQATYDDQQVVNGAYSWLEGGNYEEGFEETVGELGEIVFAGGEHSLLSKTMAIVAMSDVFHGSDRWPEKPLKRLRQAMSTEPEPGGGVILTAAFWARSMHHALEADERLRQGGEDKLATNFKQIETAEKYFLESETNSAEWERKKIAFQKAKVVISELIAVRQMRMKLPTAIITSAKSEKETVQEEIPLGYPDRTIYLGERLRQNMMPSEDKMFEAARWGVPEVSNMLLNPRGLRFLLGVELKEVGAATSKKSRLSYLERKRMLYVYRRSLVRPMDEARAEFLKVKSWTDEKVMEKASFDSLSLWVAVRASRQIRKDWEKIEVLTTDNDQKFKVKMNQLNRWVDIYSSRLIKFVGRYHKDGGQVSGLSVALKESHIYDGEEGWDLEGAFKHVKATAKALVYRSVGKDLKLRVQSEIEDLYKDALWGRMLDEDKVQLACALIGDPKGDGKKLIESIYYDEDGCAEIMECINEGKLPEEDSKGFRAAITAISNLRDEVLKMRWETIRDKRVTESMVLEI